MKKIVILEGGYNEEHEVSLNTSICVQKSLKNLNLNYEIIKVKPSEFKKKIKKYNNNYLFFNALHGPFGEDGQIQNELINNNLSYTHSGLEASKNAFNKDITKKIVSETEVPFLYSKKINKKEIKSEIFYEFFYNYNSFVLKPVCSGSSFGVKVFHNLEDIKNFFLNLKKEMAVYKNHNEIMLEKYIKGRELTVGVVEYQNISKSLAVTEIISKNKIYDYNAKYTKGMSEHIIPAKLPKKIYNDCLKFAKKVHDKLNCKSVSRSDFIFDESKLYFLEINTQPGLTETSLIPEQLLYKNISFDDFIFEIIKSSS